ncbi:putative leucine-rich repeat domain superfamily [Helianthus annuus]|nr:putative leucine-rich repeat domain superfamily [Helianthus annuus]
MKCKLFYAIHQVLLQRQGPTQEFTLSILSHETCFEIDQIILHLSRNHTLKRLTLDFYNYTSYRIPLCVFSLHHLTDLRLENCHVNLKPIFNGLGSLVRLTLYKIWMSRETLLHLLSGCPSLKSLCQLVEDWVPEELPPSLIHLKYFCIKELCFGESYGLDFIGVLLKCAPNLEKIRLEVNGISKVGELASR